MAGARAGVGGVVVKTRICARAHAAELECALQRIGKTLGGALVRSQGREAGLAGARECNSRVSRGQ